ncbi:MAG: diadenosine tetraphosphatase [Caulobacter sp.]|nr:diadenosine tetraphosphatase [Caulobacter sp.]
MSLGPLRKVGEALGRGGRPAQAAPGLGGVAGQLVYAVGDIHGRYDLLRQLLSSIAVDAADRARGRAPILIFCGDYIDRGPQSAQVLEALIWLRRRTDIAVHALRGNHEQALLDFLADPERGAPWLDFGGGETLGSYGVTPPDQGADLASLVAARDQLLQRMPAAHLRLIESLELMLVIGDHAFVHAGVRPGTALLDQAEDDLLWIRQGFIDFPGPFEKIIVHGHSWREDRPVLLDHRVGLDTGAYQTGVLTAVRFEDGERAVLQARGPAGLQSS